QIVLSFKIVVQLEDESIIEKCLRDIANSVIAKIEDGDDYYWNIHKAQTSLKFPDSKGIFYYRCSQSFETQQHEYKENSNRKRRICYNCKGNIKITIDTNLSIAVVDINHNFLHPRPDLVAEIPDELKQEIEDNAHLTTVELIKHLKNKNFDT
ncbi:2682_t:CDS:1, partial [Ambispora gerdemannii]